MADADADATEILAEMRHHGAHAIIARMAAAALHAQPPRSEIDLVVEDGHIVRRALVELQHP